jgi:hypothetical protein
MGEKMMKTCFLLTAVALLMILSQAYGGTEKVPGGIEFTYYDPSAYSVSLAGSFNSWDARANPMEKDEEGTWRVIVPLGTGTYEYKFVVNGADWMADPDNPKVVGDYGNSQIEIDNQGEPVISGFVERISNTAANARVMITGWFRGTYTTRKDALGDVRWRLTRPAHEMYVSFNPTIGSDVKGSGTIRIDSGAGDIREVTADLYAGWLKYKSTYFDATAYHNEEVVSFDDPLEVLGHRDLPGTVWEENLDYGRGTQGLIGDLRFAGLDLRALYSNTYDYDIYNSGTQWFVDVQPGLLILTLADRYDNVGTDLLALRAKRKILGLDWAGTFVSARNGWWVGFETQPLSSVLEQYRAESGDSNSFWFEMGTSDLFYGIDVSVRPVPWLEAFSEYGRTSYEAKWDAGNRVRKQADTFVDGEIDVPVGDEDGSRFKLGLDASIYETSLRIALERASFDGMDKDEVYVTNQQLPIEDPDTPLMLLYGPSFYDQMVPLNGYGGVFNIDQFYIYEHQPLPERNFDIVELDLTTKFMGVDVGLEFDIAKREWDYAASAATADNPALESSDVTWTRVLPSIKGSLFNQRLGYHLIYESTKDNISGRMPSVYDKGELLVKGDVGLVEAWSVYYNLRRVSYDWTEGDVGKDDSFFNTHLALVWSPVPRVEIRLGYGLNPLYYRDTPVDGREIGRERWMASDMWLSPLRTLVDAERNLEDLKMISLMGVIAF